MAKKEKQTAHEDPNAELLPPREALTVLPIEPSSYAGLMADPTATGPTPADPAAGAASSSAGSAQDLVGAQASAEGEENVSDQDQSVSSESSQSASSQT